MTRTDWRSGAWPRGAALALLAAVLLAGCGGAGSGAAPAGEDPAVTDPVVPPVSPPSPAVAVAFAAALPEDGFTPASEAAIASTPALWVVADWTGATADQAERLVLTSPLGSVYYAVEIPLVETDSSLVHVAVLPDGTRRAAFKLLIWGTEIEGFAELGTWTAAATLLGEGTSGAATVVLR
jgi:hypothetical protein